MSSNPVSKPGTEVQALRIVLITLFFLYAVVSVVSLYYLVRVVPYIVRDPSGAPFISIIRTLCDRVLPGVIFFFIAYSILRLIRLISRGEPFNPASPRFIRWIGYAVFGLAIVNAIVDSVKIVFTPQELLSKPAIWALCGFLSTLLLGFGFLVIARVLELGVRLQQDQNLTV